MSIFVSSIQKGKTMKKKLFTLFVVLTILALTTVVAQAKPEAGKSTCKTIQDGVLTYSSGHFLLGTPIPTGYDPYGYNYQAHLFKGSYANAYLGGGKFPPYTGDDATYLADNPSAASTWYWPYRTTQVLMKWNDAWLSNKDCNSDGALDRHFGLTSYIGSGAWITNHMWDSYEYDGAVCNWDWFTKIIAVPSDATSFAGYWYAADGTEIGGTIWGEFATIQSVYNDPCAGFTGLEYLSPDHAGFGGW